MLLQTHISPTKLLCWKAQGTQGGKLYLLCVSKRSEESWYLANASTRDLGIRKLDPDLAKECFF